ncbi:MAG: neutral/alkaline non-lysosomal ceramidase N-terminal domain-containing protein [Acidobacteria bacterium]|nr:neutral/alkaline non-lysosomal ceramidase N-terminal domain-containing protein [Acidobacteriota bacterium]
MNLQATTPFHRQGWLTWLAPILAIVLISICSGVGAEAAEAQSEPLRPPILVGAAKADVTPREPVVLAGYGGRTGNYEGIDTKLWARAMVIGKDAPVAVVVIDNCGVPAKIKTRLAERLAKHGVAPERLVVAATHTHNAPNLLGYARILWAGRTTPEQDRRTAEYTSFAIEQMEAAVVAALENRQPMRLEWAQGRATFGGNRRVLRDGKWVGFGFQRNGPVDHSLPVLAARDAEGVVRAVWANYACHCTTVGSRNHVGGDWAGFANESMEKAYPNAVSLMTIGCGADVGPQPSGNLPLAGQHGRSVADEVRRLLSGETTKLAAQPTVASKQIKLPLAPIKPRAHWEDQLRGGGFTHQLARTMLSKLDADGAIPAEVDYPLSAWKFGDDLAMVFLAGEVVVDYSVRLNRELDWSRLWISAWANDMPGYIPSRRVLAEGGYEAEFSQIYYEQPGRYDPAIEDILVSAVRDLLGDAFAARPGQAPAPFHRAPGGEAQAFKRVAEWASRDHSAVDALILKKVRQYARSAEPAIARMTTNSGEETEWHNFAGDFAPRIFIRQQAKGAELAWLSPPAGDRPPAPRVMCFTGGIGWESEPETAGFALLLGGEEKLRFDVTRDPARWASADDTVELVYLPTWTSSTDSGGFFFIALGADSRSSEGESTQFAIRSLGEGSKRWFAIDSKQEVPTNLKKLSAALGKQ